MFKMNLKKIATMLVVLEMISSSAMVAHAEDAPYAIWPPKPREIYRIGEDGKVEIVDDLNILLTQHKTVVEEGEDISIFDEKNLTSRQYGGDQRSFERNYTTLIKEPYIWEELQRVFPVEEFSSEETAMDFYHKYFILIEQSGCGYIAVANKVFEAFKGKEKEFEKIFGYPMYTINEEGVIDFNYEFFAFDFFNFSVLYPNYNAEKKEELKNVYGKTLATIEYERFIRSDEYVNRPKMDHNLTMEEVEQLAAIRDKYYELKDKMNKATDDKETSYGIKLNANFGHIQEFLKQYGIKSQLKVYEIPKGEAQPGDIIGSNNFSLYKEDGPERYSEKDAINPHSVYVVEKQGDKTFVSTWGEKYIFDDSEADWTVKVDLKIFVK